MKKRTAILTKSLYLSGLQCHRRLYLEHYHTYLARSLTTSQRARIDEGNYIAEIARNYFSNGFLITDYEKASCVETTRKILDSGKYKSLFEASFLYNNILVRVDVLKLINDNHYELIEIKAGNHVKPKHMDDLGIQYYVLTNNGLSINKASIMHINPGYIKKNANIDNNKLFLTVDLSEEIKEYSKTIELRLNKMQEILNYREPPEANIGRHCKRFNICPFLDYCSKDLPDPITELPRLSDKLSFLFESNNIKDISQIPDSISQLSVLQQRIKSSIINNSKFFDKAIYDTLDKLNYPIHFLDFEAFNPAIPVYYGTKPYQMIPFQWSNHILYLNNKVKHYAFLHESSNHPAEAFSDSLIAALGDAGSIIVFSNFEAARIKEIANACTDRKEALEKISNRLIDLQSLIKKYCYFPEFHGSFSLKKVLPAIIPELNYDELSINNGTEASQAYRDLLNLNISENERISIRNALLDYCKLDTLAMLELYKYFIKVKKTI